MTRNNSIVVCVGAMGAVWLLCIAGMWSRLMFVDAPKRFTRRANQVIKWTNVIVRYYKPRLRYSSYTICMKCLSPSFCK